jgi:hypothetical protein
MAAQTPLLYVATPAAALLLLFSGCTSETVCGPGTIEVGNACIVDDSASGGTTDDGTSTPPPTSDDAGTGGGGDGTGGSGGGTGGTGGGTGGTGGTGDDGGFSTEPPGGGGGGGAGGMGCDAASGECDTWEEAIAAGLVDRQMAAGCDTAMTHDERIDAIAEAHAAHQASIDMLTTDSPDGPLFDQVADAGVEYRDVASLFSISGRGPDDVLDRWDASDRAAPILSRCDDVIGVGVATGESGDSYVTVLMASLTLD